MANYWFIISLIALASGGSHNSPIDASPPRSNRDEMSALCYMVLFLALIKPSDVLSGDGLVFWTWAALKFKQGFIGQPSGDGCINKKQRRIHRRPRSRTILLFSAVYWRVEATQLIKKMWFRFGVGTRDITLCSLFLLGVMGTIKTLGADRRRDTLLSVSPWHESTKLRRSSLAFFYRYVLKH